MDRNWENEILWRLKSTPVSKEKGNNTLLNILNHWFQRAQRILQTDDMLEIGCTRFTKALSSVENQQIIKFLLYKTCTINPTINTMQAYIWWEDVYINLGVGRIKENCNQWLSIKIEQYNSVIMNGGLFMDYIKMILKLKQVSEKANWCLKWNTLRT